VRQYERFFQMDLRCFEPFNEAPAYLKGSIRGTEDDKVVISGSSEYQLIDWYKMGCETCKLLPHSFAFGVDAVPISAIGACSIRVQGDCAINVSHFIHSSVRLLVPELAENAYSGWGYDNSGARTQRGGSAPWESLGRRHNLMIVHDAANRILTCMVNGFPIHAISGDLGEFRLGIRFEAVGIAGEFCVNFENICYYSLDSEWHENVSRLGAWDPQFAPVFVSYSHADKATVDPFVAGLRHAGVRVLGDWDFHPGDSMLDRIAQSISRAGYLLVMLSPRSVSSSWVNKELRIGMSRELRERRVHVLPIVIDECDMPLFLTDKLYADIRTGADDARKRILDTLRRHGDWHDGGPQAGAGTAP
jgi:hypothetical protein